MLQELMAKARGGECVYMPDVAAAFANAEVEITCIVELAHGGAKRYTIRLPRVREDAELAFVREYLYACVYNLISTLGGIRMALHLPPGDSYARALCEALEEVFMVHAPKHARSGYGKCLNVTDRINAALGHPPFVFRLTEDAPVFAAQPTPRADALAQFRTAVQKAGNATICGMDIGGTDIKLVGIQDGSIRVIMEYDWNPALFTTVEQLTGPILLLVRSMRAALAVPENADADLLMLQDAMLRPSSSDADMLHAVELFEQRYGQPPLLDGIGVCFPDVVIEDMIVGGETLKTRGIREASPDYETEFSRLTGLKSLLAAHCRPGGAVHLSNDGSLAAYTAAVELAHSDRPESVQNGVFAHTLGTELGTGWIDELGEIPQIPLEVYNCIIDLGSTPARAYGALDLRSVNNFNTGLPGTLQKYTSQSGAYRLAIHYFQKDAPERYRELLEQGFIEKRDGGVYVACSPRDMRKPLLEHIMTLASAGQPQAEQVFRDIGEYLAVTFQETEALLAPKARERVLFGRFVKQQRCFELMQQGANRRLPVRFAAADDNLAYTPLMLDLKADATFTVAQFGQAVGAAYYAASIL